MIFTTIYLAGWLSVFAPLFRRSRIIHIFARFYGRSPWVADAVMALTAAAWPIVWARVILARGSRR